MTDTSLYIPSQCGVCSEVAAVMMDLGKNVIQRLFIQMKCVTMDVNGAGF